MCRRVPDDPASKMTPYRPASSKLGCHWEGKKRTRKHERYKGDTYTCPSCNVRKKQSTTTQRAQQTIEGKQYGTSVRGNCLRWVEGSEGLLFIAAESRTTRAITKRAPLQRGLDDATRVKHADKISPTYLAYLNIGDFGLLLRRLTNLEPLRISQSGCNQSMSQLISFRQNSCR